MASTVSGRLATTSGLSTLRQSKAPMGTRKVSRRNTSRGRISALDFSRLKRSARARRCLRLGLVMGRSVTGITLAIENSACNGRTRRRVNTGKAPALRPGEGKAVSVARSPGIEALFQLLAVVGPKGNIDGPLILDVFRRGGHD